jgi:hypothetical protein
MMMKLSFETHYCLCKDVCIQDWWESDAWLHIIVKKTVSIHIELSSVCIFFFSFFHIQWVVQHRQFFQIVVQKSHFDVHLFQFIVVEDNNDKYDL